jgi:hypothetical protein
MKREILAIIAFLLIIISSSFSQVNVEIQNMTYLSGTPIMNGGTIDFEDNTSVTIQFFVDMIKPSNQVVGNGNLSVFTKKNSSDFEI